MGAIRVVARADLRRHWRGTVVVAILVGLVGAVVLATVAGARRSGSALARFDAYSHIGNLEVTTGNVTPAQIQAFEESPGVARVAVLTTLAIQPRNADFSNLAIAAATDDTFGTAVDRPRLVSGRFANLAAPDEVNIGESLASEIHLGVGDRFAFQSYTQPQVAKFVSGQDGGPPAGPDISLRVVGVVRRPLDLGDRGGNGGVVVLTPAFLHKYESRIGSWSGDVLRVRTDHGARDEAQVSEEARRIFGASPAFDLQGLGIESAGANNAIQVLTAALRVFAAVVGIAGLVVVAIVLNREISISAAEQPQMRALGMTRPQRLATSSARPLAIAGTGALLAVGGAIAMSPLFPVGVARRADPDVGFHVDAAVIALGAVSLIVVVLVLTLVAAAWSTRRASGDERRREARVATAVVDATTAAGFSPSAVAGMRMAVEPGRGETAVPVRSAFIGAVLAVAGATAVIVFVASLHHVASTPRLYGWTWDVGVASDAAHCDRSDMGLSNAAGVADLAAVCTEQIEIGGRTLTGWGFTPLSGAIAPEMVSGREPRAPDEVALGATTLDALHTHVGGTVHPDAARGVTLRVVGTVAFPRLDDAQPLADGAWLTNDGLQRLGASDSNFNRYLLVRFAPGADRTAIERRLSSQRPAGPILTSTRPVEVKRLIQIDWIPIALGASLALLGIAAVGHALVTGTRRRRRDLALLKTLGFVRPQVRRTVAWQASAIGCVGLALGIPLGLLLGNFVWHVVADQLGVRAVSVRPPLVVVIIPAALLVVNLIAYWPASIAARTRVAVALRTE